MDCKHNRHVCLGDLSNYLKRTDYLDKYTPVEQAEIRRNIGAIGKEDLATIVIKNNRFTELTYSELIELINNNLLEVRNIYCITDFQSIYESNYFINRKIP